MSNEKQNSGVEAKTPEQFLQAKSGESWEFMNRLQVVPLDYALEALALKDKEVEEVKAEIERLQQKPISVKDRLPESGQRVLCIAVNKAGQSWVQIYRYSSDFGFDWMHDYEPTHWVPLPEFKTEE